MLTPTEERKDHWHLVTPDGEDIVGGLAGVTLLEQLGRTRRLGRALRHLRLHPVVYGLDWASGKLRPHLGRFVDDGPGPERYP